MPIEYEDSPQLNTTIQQLLRHGEFTAIRELPRPVIVAKLKVKFKDDEPVKSQKDPVMLIKLNEVTQAMTNTVYAVIADYVFWNNNDLPDNVKQANVHKALMQIKIDVSADGTIKFGKRGPDIQEFTATAARFAAWTEELEVLQRALNGAAEEVASTVSG